MYRKFIVEELTGNKMAFKCYPKHDTAIGENVVIIEKDELSITLETRKVLTELITIVNKFMSRNNICKVEIDEIEEVVEE